MMTEMDIIDINSFRNVLSLFGIIYLFFVCILPFFIVGFFRALSINISFFVIGLGIVVCSAETENTPASSPCWKIRTFNYLGQSVDKDKEYTTLSDGTIGREWEGEIGIKNPIIPYEWQYADDDSYKEMFAMNDKNSPDYICSVWVFNPSSLWMCPAIFALPVLFGLFVIFGSFKSLVSEGK